MAPILVEEMIGRERQSCGRAEDDVHTTIVGHYKVLERYADRQVGVTGAIEFAAANA
jgi:hypothetical protein